MNRIFKNTFLLIFSLLIFWTPATFAKEKKRDFETLKYPPLNEMKMPKIIRDTLPNGMKIIMVEDHELPQVEFRVIIRGGDIVEPKDKAALTEIFGEAHRTGGTASMNGDKADEFLEGIGAEIETSVDESSFNVSGKCLTENLDSVFPLFAGFVTSPAFSEDKISLAKTHLAGMIARRNDNVFGIAFREFPKLIYGKDSPYARQYEYDDLEKITREDLLAFHKAYFRPDTAILAIWGDINPDKIKSMLKSTLGNWNVIGKPPAISNPAIPSPGASVNYIEKKDVEQTFFVVGHMGIKWDNPDAPAIQLLSDILGGGMHSRIFINVREERGLAYAAGGRFSPGFDHPGPLLVFTATKPSTTSETLSIVLDEIKKIRLEPVTDDELKRSKDAYLNSYAFKFDSTSKIVGRLVTLDFYGYPEDFDIKFRNALDRVTKDDILRVAKEYIKPDALIILAIGKADMFDKPLSTFGEVKTIDIAIPEPKSKEEIPAATPETAEKAKTLLVKAAKAAGEAALSGLKDITTEGTTIAKTPMGDMNLKGKTIFVPPGKIYNAINTPMGSIVQVLNGESGWMKMGGQVQDFQTTEIQEMTKSLYTESGCLMLLKQALQGKLSAQYIGKTKFEGKDAEDILVTTPAGGIRLFLTPDGKEIMGSKRRGNTPKGPADVIQIYSNYQVVSGLRLPFDTVEKANDEIVASSKAATIKVNAGFSEDTFKK